MKVFQINVVCGIGSTGRIATDIHQELKLNGHESMIAYGRGIGKNCDNTYRIGSNFNIYLDVALTRFFDCHGFAGQSATKALCREIDKFRPDIVHLHNIHGYYVNVGYLLDYLKQKKIPIVWTLHDCWTFTGHCVYFDQPFCNRWQQKCGSCPRISDYPKSFFVDRSIRNLIFKKEHFSDLSDLTLVSPSIWLSNLVGQSYLKQYECKVIPNGIDLTLFKATESTLRETLKIGQKKVVLGVAMVWDRRKGLSDMFEIASALQGEIQMILVGLSKSQLQDLPKSILGFERTNSVSQLAELYSLADYTIVTSYEDNYPTVVMESLACETPVIAYETGGIPEMAQRPYLTTVPKGDWKSIIDILKHPMLIERWVFDAHRFDKANLSKTMLHLYEEKLKV